MSGSKVGTITVLEYFGTSKDAPILGPIKGLLGGESVTHAAAMLEFDKNALSPSQLERLSRLHDAGKIDFQEHTDAAGKKTYQLYYSFWPKEAWDPISKSSRMEHTLHDNEISREGSPTVYNAKFHEYLQPPTEELRSSLPIIKYFIPPRIVNVPPSIMMNLTGFTAAYPEAKFPGFEKAALDFGTKYAAWGRVSLDKKHPEPTKVATQELEASKESLFKIMFPGEKMRDQKNQERLMQALEPFVTFGIPPRDTVSLPLIKNANGSGGLAISPMIDFMLEVAENPTKHPYNLALNNCADKVLELLQAGMPQNASAAFRLALGIVPVLHLSFHPPITLPGRVTRMTKEAAGVLDEEATENLHAAQGLQNKHATTGKGLRPHHLQHQKLRPVLGTKVHPDNKENEAYLGNVTSAAKDPKTRPIPPFVDTKGGKG